jgi:hypothetical protein
MAVTTVFEVVDKVADVLEVAAGLAATQRDSEITEDINPPPILQVYLYRVSNDVISKQGGRSTFATQMQSREIVIRADALSRQRSFIGQDMQAQREITDAIMVRLDSELLAPFFDIPGCQDFRWTATQVVFDYGADEIKYVGTRFELALRIYFAT